MPLNRKVVLKSRPDGMPTPENFSVEDAETGELPPDHVLVEVDTIGIDAFIRTTLDAEGHHERSGFETPVIALGVGQVIESTVTPCQPAPGLRDLPSPRHML